MTINDYQNIAMRTANPVLTDREQLTNGVMGLCGESGECADLVKKYNFQGHDIDVNHLAKELGDVAWYLAVTAYTIGYDLETIFEMNAKKLAARFPDGFDTDKSKNRKKGDI